MTSPDREGLLHKIQSLLEKTVTNGATEGEAAAAAAMAQKLLQKYNIELDEVQGYRKTSDETAIMKIVAWNTGSTSSWETQLATTVAHFNFGKALVSPAGIYFIGKSTDLEVIEAIFLKLRHKLYWLAMERTTAHTETVKAAYFEKYGEVLNVRKLTGDMHPKVWRNNWMTGALMGIHDRMDEQQRAFRAEYGDRATALVTTTEGLVKSFIDTKWSKVGTKEISLPQDINQAVSQGYVDGKNLQAFSELAVNRDGEGNVIKQLGGAS